MIKPAWSIICSKSVIDSESNNSTIFNVFEQLTIKLQQVQLDEPGIKIDLVFEIIAAWIRDNKDVPEKGVQRITVVRPDGNTEKSIEMPINYQMLS
jgi:hypothetical protein